MRLGGRHLEGGVELMGGVVSCQALLFLYFTYWAFKV